MPLLLPDQINTERLRLCRPEAVDASSIFQAYAQDSDFCRFMIWTPHASEAVTREFIASCIEAWKAGGRLPFVINEYPSNVAIGMIEARMLATAVDIGYVLAKPHWGKGFMPEAITALAGTAHANPGTYRIHAACDTENIPSQRALEKAGFAREGRLERYTVHPNISPEPRACFMYAKCR